jgi:hypothetical protein
MQSLVIVLLRPILNNVTAIVAQQTGQQQPGGMGRSNNVGPNPGLNGGPGGQNMQGHNGAMDLSEPSPEEIDAARTREITTKAMTGILVLLLKWLRLSRESSTIFFLSQASLADYQ